MTRYAMRFIKNNSVQIRHLQVKLNTFALLDDGSTITLVNENLIRKLGIHGNKSKIFLKGINDEKAITTLCEQVNLEILVDDEIYKISKALATPKLSLASQTLSKEIVRYIAKMQSVFLQPYFKARPEILIGQDNWQLLASTETRCIENTALAVSHTRLGWVAHGPTRGIGVNSTFNVNTENAISSQPDRDIKLNELVKNYFEIDSLGVCTSNLKNSKHERAWEILKSTSKCLGSV